MLPQNRFPSRRSQRTRLYKSQPSETPPNEIQLHWEEVTRRNEWQRREKKRKRSTINNIKRYEICIAHWIERLIYSARTHARTRQRTEYKATYIKSILKHVFNIHTQYDSIILLWKVNIISARKICWINKFQWTEKYSVRMRLRRWIREYRNELTHLSSFWVSQISLISYNYNRHGIRLPYSMDIISYSTHFFECFGIGNIIN